MLAAHWQMIGFPSPLCASRVLATVDVPSISARSLGIHCIVSAEFDMLFTDERC